MKTFTILFMAVFSAMFSYGQITSTSSGGYWSDTTTWIGYVVPTETDNVVIDGKVVVDMKAECKNLTVNSGDTLTRDGYGRTLYVTGDLTNNGVITKESFTIDITGNVINNGTWELGTIRFTGTNDNTITMGPTNSIDGTTIQKADTNSFLIIGSDSKYKGCVFDNSNYNNSFYKIRIKEGSNYLLDLMNTSALKGVRFNGSGSVLKDAVLGHNYYGVSSYLEDVHLKGKTVISDDHIHFINSNVIVEDTLTRDGFGRTLYVTGDLTNNGVITKESFTIDITGNVINNGTWELGTIRFSGTNDNTITMGSTNSIDGTTIQKTDTNSFLIIGSDSKYKGCVFDNSNYNNSFYKIRTKEGSNYLLDLMKTSALKGVRFNGSGSVLKDAVLGHNYYGVSSYLEDVHLKGKTVISDDHIHFINSNVIVEDTLTRDGFGRTLYVTGDLTNNGVITKESFTIDITGNVINNGTWELGAIRFTGTNDNTITMGSTNSIDGITIQKADTNTFLIIGSDSRYNNCVFDNSNYNNSFYKIKMKSGNNYLLDLMKTSALRGVRFNGSGSVLKDAVLGHNYYGISSYLEDVHLKGKTVISDDHIHFINSNVIVEDTLTRDGYGRTLYVTGDLTNNGVITEGAWGNFNIKITGNATNNGIWKAGWCAMNGTTDQMFSDADSLYAKFRLNANVASATTWQWYKNDTAISGATGAVYEINAAPNLYGEYYCKTDAGDSRKITIVKGGSGGNILKEHFDSETFPPTGWTQKITNTANTWHKGNNSAHSFTDIDPTNIYSALCSYVAEDQDEWLITPAVTLPSGAITIEFYAGYNSTWLSNATVKLNISTDGGSQWTKIGEAQNDGKSWEWRKVAVDLSEYAGQSVMLAWQYVGNDGDLMGIDNVEITQGTTGIGERQAAIDRLLSQNYPNPFSSQTRIPFKLEKKSKVRLMIYNNLGQQIAEPVSGLLNAGNHKVIFNGTSLHPGIYYYRLVVDGYSTTKRMIIIK